jgi:hypothetical protein
MAKKQPPLSAEEGSRLLDNGYSVLLFVGGMGTYEALAVPRGLSVDACLKRWRDHEPPEGMPFAQHPFDGPNRMCAEGFTISEAIHSLAEKVFLRQLPQRDPEDK